MNIGETIEALKQGKMARRAGWNAKGMHIYLEDMYSYPIPAGVFKGERRTYAPVVCLYNARGIHQPGWVCSQEDLLATDWELVS